MSVGVGAWQAGSDSIQTTHCAGLSMVYVYTYMLQDWAVHGLGKHRISLCVSTPKCLGGTWVTQPLVCCYWLAWRLMGAAAGGWVTARDMSFQLNLLSCVLSVVSTWVCVDVAAAAQKLHVHCVSVVPPKVAHVVAVRMHRTGVAADR